MPKTKSNDTPLSQPILKCMDLDIKPSQQYIGDIGPCFKTPPVPLTGLCAETFNSLSLSEASQQLLSAVCFKFGGCQNLIRLGSEFFTLKQKEVTHWFDSWNFAKAAFWTKSRKSVST
jgi:hypothetical protein